MKISNTIIRNAIRREDQIIKLIKEGLSAEQISVEIGTSWSTLSNYCRVLGIKMHRKQRAASESALSSRVDDIIKMRQEQKTLAEIGKHYNVSRERIRQILARHAPDIAIAPRIQVAKALLTCPVCGKQYGHMRKTCSATCRSDSKRIDAWNRDLVVAAMELRDKGCTWDEIGKQVRPQFASNGFRPEIERVGKWLMSTEEFEHIFKKQKPQ